jgi:amidase
MNKPHVPFRLEEATIDELHAARKSGETTVRATVEHYIARVRAFNGPASMLVTEDGADIPAATGAVRGGKPIQFPTKTMKMSDLVPDLDKYKGPPLEYGRM